MTVKARIKKEILKVKGTAKFCHLNEPNKTYKKEYGEYQCDVVVTQEVVEQLKAQLKPFYEKELQAEQERQGGKVKTAALPIVSKDGAIIVKTKLKGGTKSKDGKEYFFSVPMYDSKTQPLPKDVQVWGGSEVVVAFTCNFWHTDLMGFGVTFQIEGVQVLKLANGGVGGVAAEKFGFTEEEGYIANGGEDLTGAFDAEEAEETTLTANF
jgi:hypothetical protein